MLNESERQCTSVSSLICHRDMPMALTCLSSLLKYSQEPIHFILHDDGSLQEEDVALLRTALRSPTIITKQQADDQMAEALNKYPAALKFRQQDFLAKKLLDCIHFNKTETFAYCDTDILFVKPFSGLFVLPTPDVHALLMRDIAHGYSMRSWQMIKRPALQVPQRANAGLLCFSRGYYDLDFIEWFLSKPELRRIPYFVEQTAWALLGWRASCRLWDPNQIAFMTPDFVPSQQFVAGHFVKTYRDLFHDYVNKDFPAASTADTIKTILAHRCTPMNFAAGEVTRRLARMMPRPKMPK